MDVPTENYLCFWQAPGAPLTCGHLKLNSEFGCCGCLGSAGAWYTEVV